MKKFLIMAMVALTGIVSSCSYDDELWDSVNDWEVVFLYWKYLPNKCIRLNRYNLENKSVTNHYCIDIREGGKITINGSALVYGLLM